MLSIGEFARRGRVSVRMLRHYDAIGLLLPAHVDPTTGYRFYDIRQIARLSRIVALKDLGFTLQQVQAILDEQIDAEKLSVMLRRRRAELNAQIEADAARLAHVEEQLQSIEDEGAGPPGALALREATVRVTTLRASWLCSRGSDWEQQSQSDERTGLHLLRIAKTDINTT